MTAKNIIEKIWNAHVVQTEKGYPDIFAIDLHLVHEVTSPQAFAALQTRGIGVQYPSATIATVDHNISTGKDRMVIAKNPTDAQVQMKTLRENCAHFGIKLLDAGSGKQGIVHVIGPELGLTQPGMTIVCGDSHTSTHGAFGALAFGIGTTEISYVLGTGCLLRDRPKTMRVAFHGKRHKGVTAKDMILKLIQKIGVAGAQGHIIEYTGDAIRALSMEERMTICNMSIECGAQAGLIAPDETTFAYMKNRPAAPKGKKYTAAVAYWHSFMSDPGATYDQNVEIDVSALAPMVTWGFNPAQSIEITEKIPDPAACSSGNRDLAEKALSYVGLKAGQPIECTPIDYVFIGSCTNARISDLRAAASVFKNRKVAKNVTVYIVPGSEQVMQMAIDEKLDVIFKKAGADFRNPGCSMCLAMNSDKVPEGKRCASTSNRNFVGRQGKGSITHLMSPLMAAAAAVTGKITDVRLFL